MKLDRIGELIKEAAEPKMTWVYLRQTEIVNIRLHDETMVHHAYEVERYILNIIKYNTYIKMYTKIAPIP